MSRKLLQIVVTAFFGGNIKKSIFANLHTFYSFPEVHIIILHLFKDSEIWQQVYSNKMPHLFKVIKVPLLWQQFTHNKILPLFKEYFGACTDMVYIIIEYFFYLKLRVAT